MITRATPGRSLVLDRCFSKSWQIYKITASVFAVLKERYIRDIGQNMQFMDTKKFSIEFLEIVMGHILSMPLSQWGHKRYHEVLQ